MLRVKPSVFSTNSSDSTVTGRGIAISFGEYVNNIPSTSEKSLFNVAWSKEPAIGDKFTSITCVISDSVSLLMMISSVSKLDSRSPNVYSRRSKLKLDAVEISDHYS